MKTIYTVGHSTRPQNEFIALLRKYRVTILMDVRKIPKSAYNPQFNTAELGNILPKRDITYIHYPPLGGLRKPLKDSPNKGFQSSGFQGFADYMLSNEFEKAIAHLTNLAEENTVAIMCAEAVPFKCHRSLISDALKVRGHEVIHIYSPQESVPHQLTNFAKVDGVRITYPAVEGVQQKLEFGA